MLREDGKETEEEEEEARGDSESTSTTASQLDLLSDDLESRLEKKRKRRPSLRWGDRHKKIANTSQQHVQKASRADSLDCERECETSAKVDSIDVNA